MKILLLMKRFSTNRDMITENFGREVRLFSEINKLGQTVTVLCADQVKKERITTKLNGMDVEIHPFTVQGIPKLVATARRMAAENDVIVGATHPLLGYIAHLAAKASGRKMVYDLRDNYETYNFTNIPFLKRGHLPNSINNHVIRSCDLAICVSESLKQKIAGQRANKPTITIQNGAGTKLFRPLNRERCRKKLGLPERVPIIVYTGHISRERGANTLIEAFTQVRQKHPDAMLLLSGQVDKEINISQPGIVYKELPRRNDVVTGINCGNVAAVPQPENDTTKYAFPYKLLEYMACGVPVVATAVGDVREVLSKYPECLAQPGNASDIAQNIISAITSKKKPSYKHIVQQYSWEKLARKLNSELVKLR
ncbi:TPA: glycosyltransferase family 4 protein [Candidatus Woesearchaeota archaeon]|nr:glycosyltransferase family 4 protein [Candidatus Woesearchaeota archaeon]